MNRSLSKGMSNIYLKLLLRRFQNFDFLGLKNLSPGQFWGAPLKQISLNLKTTCCNLKIRCLEVFGKSYDVLTSESMHLVEQKYKI